MRRRPPTVFLVCLILTAVGFAALNESVPRQHLPWRALDIEAPTGFATDAQMMRLSLSPSKSCMDMADNAMTFSSVKAEPKDGKDVCGWTVARDVLGSDSGVLSSETTMQCPLAIGTYIWIREIDGLARDYFGSPLKKIHHFGTYSCRRQIGNSGQRWSEHSFANAWDVSAFELENGERISVLKHWFKGDKDQKKFLRKVRGQACKIFRVTLSPDYNAAHANHLHVDMGPTSACN
ncbi:MAG: extensin-like domain-containing protein [Alphaproteobacteria bacterium]